jgi:hypothetical protein
MGFCADNDNQYFSNRGLGYQRSNRGGFGYGRGYGLGYRYGYMNIENNPSVSDKTIIENDIRILKDQLSSLEEQLKQTEVRVEIRAEVMEPVDIVHALNVVKKFRINRV